MATKYYGINDKWTDDDIENVIEIASEDGTVDSVKVNGEEYGGGGGGIPTITVTVEGDPEVMWMLSVTGLRNDDVISALWYNDPEYTTVNRMVRIGDSAEFLVFTDNLSLSAVPLGSATVTTEGDVTFNPGEEEYYSITGNCKFIVS